ncbi:lipoate--protein ligase [Anaerovorax odorimutans]|uniref:lipoate--protein ligase n=1 Tax=Anaerovorax odorimutans TaxID=109327 RepID=A0ABT1RM53_9FIRM|nr:lipoate--protein ligase [Anaerovorax odorimutans]MCQ4636252.1 lipoate--protein ligase [Anaerovorax odorimutans]
MIYLRNDSKDPHYNLAFEEYVFRDFCKDDPVLLLWQNEPSVIIGRHQNTVEEINSDFISAGSIHVVRRITGGGAVYHDLGNLNYSFLIPKAKADLDFRAFTTPLVSALQNLGIQAEQTGRNDVTIEGKKISGNAQHYQNGILLHHGTILFDSDLDCVKQALRVKPGKIESKGIKSVRSRVANIRPYLKRDMTIEAFKAYLLEAFSQREDLRYYQLSDLEEKEVRRLADGKYRTHRWNYGYAPKCSLTRSGYFEGGFVEIRLDVEAGKIANMKVFGDYFSLRDTREFEQMFIGLDYSRQAVSHRLEGVCVSEFFKGITRKQIERLIF